MLQKNTYKRTCNGCQASSRSPSGYACKLGHKVDQSAGIPKEVCEKPRTKWLLSTLLSDKKT